MQLQIFARIEWHVLNWNILGANIRQQHAKPHSDVEFKLGLLSSSNMWCSMVEFGRDKRMRLRPLCRRHSRPSCRNPRCGSRRFTTSRCSWPPSCRSWPEDKEHFLFLYQCFPRKTGKGTRKEIILNSVLRRQGSAAPRPMWLLDQRATPLDATLNNWENLRQLDSILASWRDLWVLRTSPLRASAWTSRGFTRFVLVLWLWLPWCRSQKTSEIPAQHHLGYFPIHTNSLQKPGISLFTSY